MANGARQATALVPLPGAILSAFDRINGGDSFAIPNAGISDAAFTKQVLGSNLTQGRDVNSRGVYAGWPAMTPKYMRHRQGRHHEYFGTMARMYVRVPGGVDRYNAIIDSFAEIETQEIARKLMGNGVGGYGGLGYIDFLLQQAGHSLGEKFQIVETLSDNYVSFFFGQQAPLFNYNGILLNTYQDDWVMRMFRLYRDIARGSQLARRGLLFYLRYDSMIVSGALTAFNFAINAEMEIAVPFTLQMLVKKVHILYRGLATPTEVPSGDNFIPQGYQLVETKFTRITPKEDSPSGDPMTDGGASVAQPGGLTNSGVSDDEDVVGSPEDIAPDEPDEGGSDTAPPKPSS